MSLNSFQEVAKEKWKRCQKCNGSRRTVINHPRYIGYLCRDCLHEKRAYKKDMGHIKALWLH